MAFAVPVAFFGFNRPDTSARVFERIRAMRPTRLLLVADGPRDGRPDEAERCRQVREIISKVDWPCEVSKNFAEKNMGCRRRFSSGMDWVFSLVERAVILEDDCVPSDDFFPFCEELLEYYANDEKVMHITGTNMQLGKKWGTNSYYFSNYNPIWGWATWRRAWKHYDVDMKALPEYLASGRMAKFLTNPKIHRTWERDYQAVYDGKIDTWDYQWTFAVWNAGGICIVPNANLITNIGFAKDALHTRDLKSKLNSMPYQKLDFPLVHPKSREINFAADHFVDKEFLTPTFLQRVKFKLSKILEGRA